MTPLMTGGTRIMKPIYKFTNNTIYSVIDILIARFVNKCFDVHSPSSDYQEMV